MSATSIITPLIGTDIVEIAAAFTAIGWRKPARQYARYLAEQGRGVRVVLVARIEGVFAGNFTTLRASTYRPFREAAIPEEQDFNVLPAFHRRGIGGRLMDEAEARIAA